MSGAREHIRSIVLYERAVTRGELSQALARALLMGTIYGEFTSLDAQNTYGIEATKSRVIIQRGREEGLLKSEARSRYDGRGKRYSLTKLGREKAKSLTHNSNVK